VLLCVAPYAPYPLVPLCTALCHSVLLHTALYAPHRSTTIHITPRRSIALRGAPWRSVALRALRGAPCAPWRSVALHALRGAPWRSMALCGAPCSLCHSVPPHRSVSLFSAQSAARRSMSLGVALCRALLLCDALCCSVCSVPLRAPRTARRHSRRCATLGYTSHVSGLLLIASTRCGRSDMLRSALARYGPLRDTPTRCQTLRELGIALYCSEVLGDTPCHCGRFGQSRTLQNAPGRCCKFGILRALGVLRALRGTSERCCTLRSNQERFWSVGHALWCRTSLPTLRSATPLSMSSGGEAPDVKS
jgi:hypothetical protein